MNTALHYLPAHLQTRRDPVAWSVRKVTLLLIFGPLAFWGGAFALIAYLWGAL